MDFFSGDEPTVNIGTTDTDRKQTTGSEKEIMVFPVMYMESENRKFSIPCFYGVN